MAEAVIVDSVRTGLAKSFRGGFNQTRADNMTAHIVDELMDRNPEVDPSTVEDVILGCGAPEGAQGHNIARNVAVLSKLPIEVGGTTVTVSYTHLRAHETDSYHVSRLLLEKE